jgi:hypothetical protein
MCRAAAALRSASEIAGRGMGVRSTVRDAAIVRYFDIWCYEQSAQLFHRSVQRGKRLAAVSASLDAVVMLVSSANCEHGAI